MKIISIINHKGGVGKTTMTGCVAQALTLCGFRVLAVDNDSQHNLSTLLGAGVQTPGIRDVYLSSSGDAPKRFMRAIRTSSLDGLHVITASRELSARDIDDPFHLKHCCVACGLDLHYDFVLVDNAPGIDVLQICAMYASDELFVPTELRQFAIDGIVEMEQMLHERFPGAPEITRIIPNFYRDTKRNNSYLLALERLFPGRITKTAIPLDPVFDRLVTDEKILFLHRLSSRGAAYYLKLVHELFDFDENGLWEMVVEKRTTHLAEESRKRFYARRNQEPDVKEPL